MWLIRTSPLVRSLPRRNENLEKRFHISHILFVRSLPRRNENSASEARGSDGERASEAYLEGMKTPVEEYPTRGESGAVRSLPRRNENRGAGA